jgi:hypothetical protein
MDISIGIQQTPLPTYSYSSPLVLNYLDTPHATLRGAWVASSTLGEAILREDESERYLRFVRTAADAGTLAINQSSLDIPAGTFDVQISARVDQAQTDCTLGMREGNSQAAGDQVTGASFTTAAGDWTELLASVTLSSRSDWTLLLRLGAGAIGDVIDIRLASIMPNGQAPFTGNTAIESKIGDFYYWEGATNGSKSIKATRALSNEPGSTYTIDNLTKYSIEESVTPLSPSDTSGGATTVQLGIEDFDQAVLLAGSELTVLQGGESLVQGRVDAPTSDGDTLSLVSMSILSRLNVLRRVPPFSGSLDGYIAMLMASAGVSRPLTVDVGIAERPVVAHGFRDNVLSRVKEFCSAHGVELSDRGDSVFLRLPRERELDVRNISMGGMGADSSQLSQQVEVMNYNSLYLTDALIYPQATYDDSSDVMSRAGWTPDVAILTVPSGSVAVYEVPILGSLVSVEQPVCVKSVGPDEGGSGSVYTVIGQGGVSGGEESIETLDPDEWAAMGGSVTVEVGEDYDTLVITISSGQNERLYGPYALAMNAGSGTTYSSLRVRGTGIVDFKEKIIYPTGVAGGDVDAEDSAAVDTPYIQSRAQADRVAGETVATYSRPRTTATGRIDNPGFEPGDISGARFRKGDSFFRVTSATSSQSGVSFSAGEDTTMADLDGVWGELDFTDFDAVWENRTFDQFGAAPLANS